MFWPVAPATAIDQSQSQWHLVIWVDGYHRAAVTSIGDYVLHYITKFKERKCLDESRNKSRICICKRESDLKTDAGVAHSLYFHFITTSSGSIETWDIISTRWSRAEVCVAIWQPWVCGGVGGKRTCCGFFNLTAATVLATASDTALLRWPVQLTDVHIVVSI